MLQSIKFKSPPQLHGSCRQGHSHTYALEVPQHEATQEHALGFEEEVKIDATEGIFKLELLPMNQN